MLYTELDFISSVKIRPSLYDGHTNDPDSKRNPELNVRFLCFGVALRNSYPFTRVTNTELILCDKGEINISRIFG